MFRLPDNAGRAALGLVLTALCWLMQVQSAAAHASEQAFVLLLPTDVYIAAGCAAVAFSMIVVALVPPRWLASLFRSVEIGARPRPERFQTVTSLLSFIALATLLVIGVSGPRDPLTNLLPLTIWTIWWVVLVTLHGVFGNLWAWINPWTGLFRLSFGTLRNAPLIALPKSFGMWPGVVLFVLFFMFLIADPAPQDPARLANIVFGYWLLTFAGMVVFGAEAWLTNCECFTMLFRRFAALAPVQWAGKAAIGVPGWAALRQSAPTIGGAVFILILLGSGSFDGIGETFWWLGKIGVNPLEFPGRSAVIWPTIAGLLAANIALVVTFAGCIWLGLTLANAGAGTGDLVAFRTAFARSAVSVLPIAFGYHIAHYLTSFLVDGQYAIAALSDPLARGADILGLGQYQITTGFFSNRDSVRLIWLTQAGVVVGVHILAVLMAHAIAADLFKTRRRVILSQLPLAIFMILYTFLGLWLLASPRGV